MKEHLRDNVKLLISTIQIPLIRKIHFHYYTSTHFIYYDKKFIQELGKSLIFCLMFKYIKLIFKEHRVRILFDFADEVFRFLIFEKRFI